MFNPFRREDPQLGAAIAEVYKEMKNVDPQSAQHDQMVKQLTDLNALKNKGVDPNTLLIVAGNIAIAAVVITHEQTSVITTKVLPFLAKH
jgi:hypothetical protein